MPTEFGGGQADGSMDRATFERAGVGMAHVGLGGEFIDVNRHFCEFIGYRREELLGATFNMITHPEDEVRNLKLFQALLRRQNEGYRIEKRYVRSTGEIVWADLSVAILRDRAGQPERLISVVTDISGQKQNEERLKFLLGEMNHRARNMLTVIQATARQLARNMTSIEEFLAAFDQRLTGMATAQNLLLRDDQEQTGLAELVLGQLSLFVTRDDPRIRIEGEDVRVGANAARALSLSLHELATNACKHGALSTAMGSVRIGWERQGDSFLLSWTERGGPPVQPPSRSGFGRTIIERVVALSLEGVVDLQFAPEGLCWRLTAPAAALFR